MSDSDSHDERSDGEIVVSNEFAEVKVKKIQTGKGEKLVIDSPKRGSRIELDAMILESISWQNVNVFSDFLETPLGPEDDQ